MGILLKGNSLKKFQDELLSLLVEFDRICKENGIVYYLSCGTLLGAVRHKGFIPWDDDADVEMTRKEYKKFRMVCQNGCIDSERFFFQDSTTDKGYNWPYGKLRIRNTRYLREGQSHLKQQDGICIDIFILDNVPSNKWLQCCLEKATRFCRKILWSPVGAKRLHGFWRCFFWILHLIPRELALGCYHWLVTRWSDKHTEWLGFFNTEAPMGKKGHRFETVWYKREWYASIIEHEFAGRIFPIPAGYDDILRIKYHDYMVLPPEEKQCGNSDAEYIKFSDGEELRI